MRKVAVSLKEYKRKRDFTQSAEPPGHDPRQATRHRFVVQKHWAKRPHYDFRLEMDGTLKSWAVPKGIPFLKGERRLAVEVEDHPLSYADFEGTIPQGHYGGGTVMLWDQGIYASRSGAPLEAWKAGKIHFELRGQKLRGEWHLVRLRDSRQWLIFRAGKDMRPLSKRRDDCSVISGRTMKEIANGGQARPVKRPLNKPVRGRARAEVPLPRLGTMKPMMAKAVSSAPSGDWFYEIKLDGFRTLALKHGKRVELRSRNGHDVGEKFHEVREAIAQMDVRRAVFDGEIVALDQRGVPSFQLLQAYEPGQERPPLFFYAFDLLWWENEDLREKPLVERRARLEKLLKDAPAIVRYSASLNGDVKILLAKAKRLGLEGLVGKRKDSVYEAGRRSGAWIKLKLHHEQEMVIGGYTVAAGSRKYFGALLVGFHENKQLKFAGKVGTGFDDKSLRAVFGKLNPLEKTGCPFSDLPEKKRGRHSAGMTVREMAKCHWVEPKLVCQVKFSEWTRDKKLRHPVFLGLREDKSPEEVVREAPVVL